MNRVADVIVVGGGVMGCGIAYELAKKSVSVLLVDCSLPGRATSASAGGLWPVGEAVGLGRGASARAQRGGVSEAVTAHHAYPSRLSLAAGRTSCQPDAPDRGLQTRGSPDGCDFPPSHARDRLAPRR